MFRYVKGPGKDVWRLVENSEAGIKSAIASGAHFTTVLSIDKDVDNDDTEAKIAYKGPLYFDIDSEDEDESLIDCRKLLLALYSRYGVNLNDLVIHCTGGKGFHVLVPPKVFGTDKAHKFLPYTYKKMVLEFNLVHLDYGIYSAGKGRMWRLENIKRENGRYKVRLTAAQIFCLSFDKIKELTYLPGAVTPFKFGAVEYSAELAALFKRCEFKPTKIVAVPDEKLKKLDKDPACIKKLLALEDIAEGRRFNHVIMAAASYAKGRGWNQDFLEEAVTKILEEYPSSVYKSLKDKQRHVRSIFKYMASLESYQFCCDNMRRTVNVATTLCPNCPVQKELSEEDYDSSLGIEVVHNCYFRRSESSKTQLSTFVIIPNSVIEFQDTRNDTEYTIYTTLISDNKRVADVVFTQPDWASKSALIKKLPHPDFAYLGGDTDVQRLFKIVSQLEIPTKTGVKVIGLHKVKDQWHFVSKEGSLSANGVTNELLLENDYYLPTSILSTVEPDYYEMQKIVNVLFKFNAIEITVPLIGWFCAAFFKERIFEITRQFPLLFIFGAAGAGKTQTILNLKRLFCLGTDNVKSIADVTPFTLIKSANCNNTIPLMLDEYKCTTFSLYQVKMVSKLIRAAYNNELGERGTSSQQINTYYYRSPIIIAGEQTVTEPAARDRIIEVHMNKLSSAPHLEQFKELAELPIEKLGRALLVAALKIDADELKAILNESQADIPPMYQDRPKLNQAIVLTGLKLLSKILEPYGFADVPLAAWRDFTEKSKIVAQEDFEEQQKTDVDRIFEVINTMSDTDERYRLGYDWEYFIDGDLLYINMRVVHMKFLKFVAEYNAEAEPMNYTSFSKLLKREPYFIKDNVVKDLKSGPKICTALSVSKLLAKGLNLQGLLQVKNDNKAQDLSIKD